jgi:DNA-binding GntR family transcriptional regulator
MDQRTAREPAHLLVYQRLREMILFGELLPGQPVTILGLIERLDAGMTPVREALRRLTAEGALQPQDNRRVAVPELDAAALEELAFARLALEPELARRACNQLTESDIQGLSDCDARLNTAMQQGDVAAYLRFNHQFHMDLYAGARAPFLFALTGSLWLRAGPSLRVVCGRWGTMQLADRHAEQRGKPGGGDRRGHPPGH